MLDYHKIIGLIICQLCCLAAMVSLVWHFACGDMPMAGWSAGFIGISITAGLFVENM